jgi:2-amino-4-hydroxy-6-hydroxymethyldihydropteridine diphosphokinase
MWGSASCGGGTRFRVAEIFVALGSNIEPERRLRQAAQLLKAVFPDVRFSHCYRNPAVGFEGQDFVNAAACFHAVADVPALLDTLHRIEEQCGRHRDDPQWAPRAMDLDVLLIDDHVGAWPGLRLPRADLLRRAYMLGPAAELAPDLMHPTVGRSLAELWRELEPQAPRLTRVALDLNGVE